MTSLDFFQPYSQHRLSLFLSIQGLGCFLRRILGQPSQTISLVCMLTFQDHLATYSTPSCRIELNWTTRSFKSKPPNSHKDGYFLLLIRPSSETFRFEISFKLVGHVIRNAGTLPRSSMDYNISALSDVCVASYSHEMSFSNDMNSWTSLRCPSCQTKELDMPILTLHVGKPQTSVLILNPQITSLFLCVRMLFPWLTWRKWSGKSSMVVTIF